MQTLESLLSGAVALAVQEVFNQTIDPASVVFQQTNPQFEGDTTLVVFPYAKAAGKNPEEAGKMLGEYLQTHVADVESFNVVKGFLNLVISNRFWMANFQEASQNESFGMVKPTADSPLVVVEYSSPNTNKPLHLGHVRNNLLGYSVGALLQAAGNQVKLVNLVNDRGIHICKSMLAWQKFGNGETPESAGMKGDKLVGKYYVEFDKHYKAEIAVLVANGKTQDEAEKQAPMMTEAQEMLRQWEAGNPEVKALWEKMNGWVYAGFESTYKAMGVRFDKFYYESQTYLLGKSIVEEGLQTGVLQKRPDGAVVLDLTTEKLDQKVLLRSDGTSVYMTQDLGTAVERRKEFPFQKHIYVVGNEQEHHFKVLKIALAKLGYAWADGLHHLSYGMVELPEGKMKSREGTVVDADDLIASMEAEALALIEEKGIDKDMAIAEKEKLAHQIGMAALKYFLLKVDPKKKMMFNPKESIDLQGNTGPFIQYTVVRIRNIWRKSGLTTMPTFSATVTVHPKEKELLKLLDQFPVIIQNAAANYSPAVMAMYCYDLAKTFNQFYDLHDVLHETNQDMQHFRMVLIKRVANTIESGMAMLGIEMPERM
jgi:arginyl-tRNA synthetase